MNKLNEVYEMMRKTIDDYHNGNIQAIVISPKQFFDMYQIICYMQQIKKITDDM